jgi:hypothetical protein
MQLSTYCGRKLKQTFVSHTYRLDFDLTIVNLVNDSPDDTLLRRVRSCGSARLLPRRAAYFLGNLRSGSGDAPITLGAADEWLRPATL